MTAPIMIGGDRGGFSAFYGALAVVLCATLVFGAIAVSGPAAVGAGHSHGEATALAFLHTVLASTEPVGGAPLLTALGGACLETSCAAGTTPRELLTFAGDLADGLAKPLGARYLLVLVVGESPEIRSGDLAPSPGLAMARAEIFHAGLGGFLGLTLFLELP